LGAKLTWLNMLSSTILEVYPIDKFGRKLSKPLKWSFQIYFETW
jgi:hypothetical protein